MHQRSLLPLISLLAACAPAPAPEARAPVQVEAASAAAEPPTAPAPASQGAHLEICRVDDDLDPLAGLAAPESIAIEQEIVGPQARGVSFASVEALSGESPDSARRRLQAWLDTVPLPPSRRFGVQSVAPRYREQPGDEPAGWRSFVIVVPCELDDKAVESARVSQDPNGFGFQLAIELRRAASDSFADLTEAMLHRRLALILDGTVMVAPKVMARIGGGRLNISLGTELVSVPLQFASGVPIKRD